MLTVAYLLDVSTECPNYAAKYTPFYQDLNISAYILFLELRFGSDLELVTSGAYNKSTTKHKHKPSE